MNPIYMTEKEKSKKLSYLKEKYNFKFNDELNCYQFVLCDKIGFIVNLKEDFYEIRTIPFFIAREHLQQLVDLMVEEPELDPEKWQLFAGISMEIIANMLDERKMGSIENFINTFWKTITKDQDTSPVNELVAPITEVLTMIDISVSETVKSISKEEMVRINTKYIQKHFGKSDKKLRIYAMEGEGKKPKLLFDSERDIEPNSEPESGYNLENMNPINNEEI